ncbi:MAG: DUF192 domain-containing protein [Rhodoferax sp.]|nr:DUF192 domain-containing protein [Rhodoferax sp.]
MQMQQNDDMKLFATTLLSLTLTLTLAMVSLSHAQSAPQMDLPRTKITVGMHLIDAQVAATPEQHATGLMFRSQMPSSEGMLFVFDRPVEQCFWMKNTLLPLTAAFVADDGTIVNLADMKPQTTKSHCSRQPVRYVLEMNQGWFDKRGIKAGAKLNGAPFGSK